MHVQTNVLERQLGLSPHTLFRPLRTFFTGSDVPALEKEPLGNFIAHQNILLARGENGAFLGPVACEYGRPWFCWSSVERTDILPYEENNNHENIAHDHDTAVVLLYAERMYVCSPLSSCCFTFVRSLSRRCMHAPALLAMYVEHRLVSDEGVKVQQASTLACGVYVCNSTNITVLLLI